MIQSGEGAAIREPSDQVGVVQLEVGNPTGHGARTAERNAPGRSSQRVAGGLCVVQFEFLVRLVPFVGAPNAMKSGRSSTVPARHVRESEPLPLATVRVWSCAMDFPPTSQSLRSPSMRNPDVSRCSQALTVPAAAVASQSAGYSRSTMS